MPIHYFNEDLNEGRDVADAFTGTLFQSRVDDGEKECRNVSVLELELCHQFRSTRGRAEELIRNTSYFILKRPTKPQLRVVEVPDTFT